MTEPDAVTAPNHHPPIPGVVIDPPPRRRAEAIARVDAANQAAGIVFRAVQRFLYARAWLLAAGTTYYTLIAAFSVVAFAYGVTAWIGSDEMADLITEAIQTAFPGVAGDTSVTAEAIRASGQAFSLFGALALLYSGTGAVVAAGHSIHMIYGAALDPRNIVRARVRALGWLAALGPLIMLSFTASALVMGALTRFSGPLARLVDAGAQAVIYVITYALDIAIVYLILSNLGGIRPSAKSLRIGAAVGGLAVTVLKSVAGLVVAWSIARPQFGAFAAPITVLFVLFLQTSAVYGAACLTAGVAEKDGETAR